MKERILDAIGVYNCHLIESIMGHCCNDYKDTCIFVRTLSELLQDGIVYYDKAEREYEVINH